MSNLSVLCSRVKNWALKFGVDLWEFGRQFTKMSEIQKVSNTALTQHHYVRTVMVATPWSCVGFAGERAWDMTRFPPSRSLPTQCPWLPSHLIRYNVNNGRYTTNHRIFSSFFQVFPSRFRYSKISLFQILYNSSFFLDDTYSSYWQSWDSSVGIETGLTTGIRFQLEARDFSFLLHNILTDPEAHPTSYPNGYRGLFPQGLSRRSMKLTIHLHLVPRSRMGELYLHHSIRLHSEVLYFSVLATDRALSSSIITL
jgi:hypothetical protein